MGFTEPDVSPRPLVVSYSTLSPLPLARGGLLSVALACGLLRVGVTHHPALWCPDFPRPQSRSSAAPSRSSYFSQDWLERVIRATKLAVMMILLPPSEGKTAPQTGSPLDFNELLFPELSGERRTLIQELQVVSSLAGAHEILRVGKTLTDEITANQRILDAPTAPAWQVYTGVLYDALDYGTLEGIDENVTLAFSALFGVTRLSDRIPTYRFPAAAKLPGIGNTGTWWRERLTDQMADFATGPIIDCRSSSYKPFWKTPPLRTVTIDVFQRVNGELKVVSHWAKQARGFVARHLLQAQAKQPLGSIDQVADSVSEIYEVEMVPPTTRKPASLRIVLN